MSWDRPTAVAGLVDVLEAATAAMTPPASVFPQPPSTFNPPALVVQYPQTVVLHTPAFGVDIATLTVMAAAGLEDPDTVDDLLEITVAAIEADATLQDAVQHAKPVEYRNWRILNIAGAEYLVAELALEIRM